MLASLSTPRIKICYCIPTTSSKCEKSLTQRKLSVHFSCLLVSYVSLGVWMNSGQKCSRNIIGTSFLFAKGKKNIKIKVALLHLFLKKVPEKHIILYFLA